VQRTNLTRMAAKRIGLAAICGKSRESGPAQPRKDPEAPGPGAVMGRCGYGLGAVMGRGAAYSPE